MSNCDECKNRGKNSGRICAECVRLNNYESNGLYAEKCIDISKEMAMLSRILPPRNLETTFYMPEIKKVIFNDPATIVLWDDGDKTVVKCGEYERFDSEKGLAMAISKKALGNKGNYYKVFKKWLREERYFEEDVAESFRRLAENVRGFKKKDGTGISYPCTLKEYCVANNLFKNKVYGMIKRGELKAEKNEKDKWIIYGEEE